MIDRINAPGLPKPQSPYSHAVKAGGFIYVSGQVALDPATNQFSGDRHGGRRDAPHAGTSKTILRRLGWPASRTWSSARCL
jgi:enamine deaminase RidA (YjgF/YER057c/UK114 family)